jgi:hypothetical protein
MGYTYLLIFSAEHPCNPQCISTDFQSQAPMYPTVHILIFSAEHPCNPQLYTMGYMSAWHWKPIDIYHGIHECSALKINKYALWDVHIYWFSVPSTHATHNAYLLIFSHKHPCIPPMGYMSSWHLKSIDIYHGIHECSALKINKYAPWDTWVLGIENQ